MGILLLFALNSLHLSAGTCGEVQANKKLTCQKESDETISVSAYCQRGDTALDICEYQQNETNFVVHVSRTGGRSVLWKLVRTEKPTQVGRGGTIFVDKSDVSVSDHNWSGKCEQHEVENFYDCQIDEL